MIHITFPVERSSASRGLGQPYLWSVHS